MILVTVGTNEQPFDRLVRAAAAIGGSERLLVQYGSSQVARGRGEWVDFLPFDVLAEHTREARVVVCHAGVGSIMLARRYGHRSIVVPRRRHHGEAVDDHQLFLARRLHDAGLVTLLEDVDDLAEVVLAANVADGPQPASELLRGADALNGELRSFLTDLGVAPRAAAAVGTALDAAAPARPV